MATLKYSRQRESIKEYLSHTHDHPTADMVYAKIREIYPNISLGTVYRNLNLLVDQGEVIKVTCGDGSDHFDYKSSPHYHLVCQKCGCVQDLELDLSSLDALAAKNFNGEVTGHNIIFYGICEECKQN